MARDARLPCQPKTVIVVDGDASMRHSLHFSLAAEGFSVSTYKNGHDLLAAGDLPANACLVIEDDLRDMSGLDLVAILRSRQVALPAILVTSNANAPLRRRAEEAGVSMVEKPLMDDSLVQGIRAALAP